MRLDASAYGLIACVVGAQAEERSTISSSTSIPLPGRATTSTTSSITFSPSQFHGESNIIPPETNLSIAWIPAQSVTVTKINWVRWVSSSSYEFVGTTSPTTQFPRLGRSRNEDGTAAAAVEKADEIILYHRENWGAVDTSKNELTLNITRQMENSDTHSILNTPIFLQLLWNSTDKSGTKHSYSYSTYFALTNYSEHSSQLGSLKDKMGNLSLNKPALSEGVALDPPNQLGTGGVSQSPTSVSAVSAVSGPVSSSLFSLATTTPVIGQANESGSKPSGLAIGAIVGIAVGCGIAGLLIIGFLVWFLCFSRRRDHKPMQNVGYASDSGVHGMMADKEMPVINDSPRSQYPDDNSRLHDGSSMVVSTHGQEDDGSYAPYSDRTATPPGAAAVVSGTGAGAAAGATASQTELRSSRSPTPPIVSRYAHLVEEGMTEDEIRRLEEEERQLDAAIEDAGRNSRAA
ncbi:uncharacterized protein BCR38DRAFT_413940 [Pseudomassariella vexata]|uniref:Mid2 domain-containing protein n=1 Tax=Pseudomassariella vexata TaxID=1141098 RepID=A0A1Y2DE38_9PEZI|nr:uncharacterized protein BCR38DRAFT_413940 [Pseudomassariella vexata]ORY57553.1 hypothetical protein BCR38DRAFT_413940 [Pseudomassariella vexata]